MEMEMTKGGFKRNGNINMRGKRQQLLSCRCCECIDLRGKFLAIAHARDVSDALSAPSTTPASE
jgi:hypothetical protein